MYLSICSGKITQILSCFLATFGIFAYGIAHLWPAPVVPRLLINSTNGHNISTIQITTTEGSWITSFEMIALPVASAFTIVLIKKYSAKYILFLTSLPLILSWILIIYAENVIYFYVARILVGIAHAFSYGTVSIYISEIAEPKIRGVLNFFIPIMFNVGGLITYSFAYSLRVDYFAKLALIAPVLHFILFVGMPQSPYYLIACNKLERARKSLQQLRGNKYTEREFQMIKESVQNEMKNEQSFKKLFDNSVSRKSVGLIVMLTLLQQLSGSTSVPYYLHYIIEESKIQLDVELAATISGLVILLGNICSTFLVDRKGRRPLIFFSIIGAGISITLEGLYFYLKENNYNVESFALVSLILLAVYIYFTSCGIIFMGIFLAGELFPANIRSYGAPIVLMVYGVFGVIANKAFQIITDTYGMSYIFFIFGFFCLLGLIATYFLLPETRNKSLAEIQVMLSRKKPKNQIGNNQL